MSELPPQWIYILHCEKNRLYTGFTTDMIKRYRSHLDGSGKAKFTRSFKPLGIAQCWRLENAGRGIALRLEAFIKKHQRAGKIRLIEAPATLAEAFEAYSGIAVELKIEAIDRLEQQAQQQNTAIEGKTG